MAEENTLSFARKYRPKNLNEYIGNTELKETLKLYLKSKRPNTVLLTGTTGCGKTTIARLITKEYFCKNWSEETGACNTCEMCQYMNTYIETGDTDQLPDVNEVDIGTQGNASSLKELIETMQIPPAIADWKVYIFDEFHLASNQAQSALLKVIEEPPDNVLIIFCTTDPQLMLPTIKNRCQLKLSVQKPKMIELIEHLRRICKLEGKEYDIEGLRAIITRSDFIVRDSLNNLERVIETRGNARIQNVSQEFKTISENLIFKFYEYYKKIDIVAYISLLYRIRKEYDFNQFLRTLENFTLRGIYIVNGVQDIEGLSQEEWDDYSKLFSKFSQEELSIILNELNSLNLSNDVESNLIAFIYKRYENSIKIKKINTNNNGNIPKVEENNIKTDMIGFEERVRKQNLDLKEKSKLKKGEEALLEEAKLVTMESLMSEGFFPGERID